MFLEKIFVQYLHIVGIIVEFDAITIIGLFFFFEETILGLFFDRQWKSASIFQFEPFNFVFYSSVFRLNSKKPL